MGSIGTRHPIADLNLVVKRYARPSAGAAPPKPSELRPLNVLRDTVNHLLKVWAERTDQPSLARYNFISDRFRAVQQDMTVQRLVDKCLWAQIARFHILMELEFSVNATPDDGFSSYQNRSLLCNVLISALDAPCNGDDGDDCRLHAELAGYFVLLHSADPVEVNLELLRLPSRVLTSAPVQFALGIVGAMSRNDAFYILKSLRGATIPQLACLLNLVARMRRLLLQQFSVSWNSREVMACDIAAHYFGLDNATDMRELARALGIAVEPLFDSSSGGGKWGDEEEEEEAAEEDATDFALRFRVGPVSRCVLDSSAEASTIACLRKLPCVCLGDDDWLERLHKLQVSS